MQLEYSNPLALSEPHGAGTGESSPTPAGLTPFGWRHERLKGEPDVSFSPAAFV